MGAITLDIFRLIYITHESYMSLFPIILALRDTQVHIGFLNCYNVASNIEVFINEVFCSDTILKVSDINLNYNYIQFGRSFDNSEFGYKNSVIKNMSTFDYYFNNICRDREISIFNKVKDI